MTRRGPLDFLAAIVVEFGGLVLLLGAIPLLSSGAKDDARPAATAKPASSATLVWPRETNPTPWDQRTNLSTSDNLASVETRLEKHSAQLVQGLVGQIEQVLDERTYPANQPVTSGVSQLAPQLPRITATTSAAAQAPYEVR